MNYPQKLEPIFTKLISLDIYPVIVGGYVRDFFLDKLSKDIDIELYNIDKFDDLQKILKDFGSINIVGKSFGVCKLNIDELQIDFSLPRTDSKIGTGHKGFKITTNPKMSFKEAASRRDFTVNAIGYDIKTKKILDPFSGREDIKNRVLKAIDNEKFIQDPLRVLRGVGFCARFDFKMSKELKLLCKDMIQNRMLEELSKQRVFEEIKKIIFKSKKPSKGFLLLKELSEDNYLNIKEFEKFLILTDKIKDIKHTQKQLNKTITLIQQCLKDGTAFEKLLLHIKNLQNPSPILQGRDIISFGIKPSKEFKNILDEAFKAQLNKTFNNHEQALLWLKKYLNL